ncbi:MAG: 30S ribosomal protein S7 [Candidatus Wildermuthbacteria bacterium RIFCSPHIGHO2_12_FULL_45_9]|uniref:Small ribosomal subunit protein uS7 n=1 Tax=Candidatus Wildermuthbacteria bacterium RIFCSPHIGHO2_02_FULL_45_25 TaxID=1802450 RepID=A0A1G2R6P2_9BACT|nr:MAG: 30S ribosomal protein S7 [Candidatus Wildermuthbacteria bacterium RIFCSPHIGHO2_01_FULL_45_20]OHA67922.1 MAG: 30S ribosomal protein S7 [Candidatus Wildermuthbacteria bacterium RIFCSPHIGHO2_02_FULL_45_25]OHA72287.1 MAG: 30S ribosomal protein S7 [Candidatus Wildermuthbacteria bacterium RIFCSPHIGHO2_12_FULL_45_9]
MARGKISRHPVDPDALYNSELVSKFTNYVMRKGKKSVARKIVYGAFSIIEKETKQNPLEVFEKAIENAAPLLEVRSKRVGGATYQVPVEVKGNRKIGLASRWILNAARAKKGRAMQAKLAEELIAAYKNEGSAVKKKEDTHRMAEANRAFAHFAW